MVNNDLRINEWMLFINPADENGMWKSQNCEEDQVWSDPILVWGHGPHEGGNPWKKDQRGEGQGAG